MKASAALLRTATFLAVAATSEVTVTHAFVGAARKLPLLPKNSISSHQPHRHHHSNSVLLALSDPSNYSPARPEVPNQRRRRVPRFFNETVLPVLQFTLYSLALALLCVAWEDVACQKALPSRQYRNNHLFLVSSSSSVQQQQNTNSNTISKNNAFSSWGQATVRGMGFGRDERLLLSSETTSKSSSTNDDDDDNNNIVANLRSYNEVLLEHRTVRVPQWRKDYERRSTSTTTSTTTTTTLDPTYYGPAIHTLCACLKSIAKLQQQVNNYQWDTVRSQLQTEPCWQQLGAAASRLRSVDDAVGFDWSSCAWRGRCNALADAQEALDELDFLAGVLEPYEALFCLDIVERSLRDMLARAPWNAAMAEDVAFWSQEAGAYRPHRVFDPEREDEESERIDDEYVQALQSFKID